MPCHGSGLSGQRVGRGLVVGLTGAKATAVWLRLRGSFYLPPPPPARATPHRATAAACWTDKHHVPVTPPSPHPNITHRSHRHRRCTQEAPSCCDLQPAPTPHPPGRYPPAQLEDIIQHTLFDGRAASAHGGGRSTPPRASRPGGGGGSVLSATPGGGSLAAGGHYRAAPGSVMGGSSTHGGR